MADTLATGQSDMAGQLREWRVSVTVVPKAGVNDPEGEAIRGGLHGLGFEQVRRVRAGRLFTVDVLAGSAAEAAEQAQVMADRLLANPVIESFNVDIVEPIGAEETLA